MAEGYAMRSGNTGSCGCLQRERASRSSLIHGDSRGPDAWAPEYRSYVGMLQRCSNPAGKSYPDYGGRGIKVCARWRDGEGNATGYECFLADVGRKPSPGHSIDRIDNEGHYEPGNVRWATRSEQEFNKRRKANVVVDGKLMPLVTACDILGVKPDTARNRVRGGMTPEQALKLPGRPR